MDRSSGSRAKAQALPGASCPSCGGSGVLRTDASGYRTCLDCVGQGSLPRYESAGFPVPAEVFAPPEDAPRTRFWRGGFRGEVSAWTSGAR
jgi:hypothetical protein